MGIRAVRLVLSGFRYPAFPIIAPAAMATFSVSVVGNALRLFQVVVAYLISVKHKAQALW